MVPLSIGARSVQKLSATAPANARCGATAQATDRPTPARWPIRVRTVNRRETSAFMILIPDPPRLAAQRSGPMFVPINMPSSSFSGRRGQRHVRPAVVRRGTRRPRRTRATCDSYTVDCPNTADPTEFLRLMQHLKRGLTGFSGPKLRVAVAPCNGPSRHPINAYTTRPGRHQAEENG